jgi:hypothetical protein
MDRSGLVGPLRNTYVLVAFRSCDDLEGHFLTSPCTLFHKRPYILTKCIYSHALHNDVSVNDGPHI